jgi:hypothetical protein
MNILNNFFCARQYIGIVGIAKIYILSLLFCSACGNKEQAELVRIKFDREKWSRNYKGHYTCRKQMVNDILTNYNWKGVHKDSVISMLGQADAFEEGGLLYVYDKRPFLGGLGTSIEAIVFELSPDSIVKVARLNDGGWD